MTEVILAIVILDMNHLVHQYLVTILTNAMIILAVKVTVLIMSEVIHARATLDTKLVKHHPFHA